MATTTMKVTTRTTRKRVVCSKATAGALLSGKARPSRTVVGGLGRRASCVGDVKTRHHHSSVTTKASPLDGLFGSEDQENLTDAEGYVDGSLGGFTITKVSFGSIALYTGSALLAYGFGAYFDFLPGTDFSAVMLIYGFPASLIGFALKYAQLDPVACRSKPEAIALRDTKATDIQNQIREDVTRYRYGDEQHLDFALERILKMGRYGGVPRKFIPTLFAIREEVRDGEYALTLEFEHKDGFPGSDWDKFLEKATSFFGPGIQDVELKVTDRGAELILISDGSGSGITGAEKGDVLPPLMPGLAPREQ